MVESVNCKDCWGLKTSGVFCGTSMMPWDRPINIPQICSPNTHHPANAYYCTRNSLTFVNTTAIAYTKILRLRSTFCPYAIAVVFTNVREIRVHKRQEMLGLSEYSSIVWCNAAEISHCVIRTLKSAYGGIVSLNKRIMPYE